MKKVPPHEPDDNEACGWCHLFEFPAVAWVDDGVQAAVKVAKPENHFEEGLRRT